MHAHEPSPDLPLRLGAALIATASTAFMIWLLLRPTPPVATAPDLEVVLIERIAPPPQVELELQPDAEPQRPRAPSQAAASRPPHRAAPAPARTAVVPARPPAPAAPPTQLYNVEGRIALAPNPEFDPMKRKTHIPGSAEDPEANKVRDAFERENPLPPPEGGFGGWASEGTLGEALVENVNKRLKKIADKLPGRKQIQEVRARPPPPVRFNPALHERPSDLGSEATGDAYKAAPIAFERAPGLRGEASKRIRVAIGELEARRGECGMERLRKWLAPALAGLDELQRIERSYASGADPVNAQQLLPRSADMAYDRARRAIWYADKQGESCAKS